MDKLLEVREFDRISCNRDFKSEYAFLPETAFQELLDFIHDYEADADHADALEFLKIGYRRKVGDIVSVNNFVGVIQLKSGYQIEILPKIDFGSSTDNGNKETKQIFLKMLKSMRDFPSKVFNEASLNVGRMPLYEIFINLYLQEVRALVKHGLKSAYIPQQNNLQYFRGKLLINEHIRQNATHRERFFMQYDEYLTDRAENRLIKSTLLKLNSITSLAENQKEIRQLLAFFELVHRSSNYEKDFSRVVIDRNTKDYDIIMQWSKIFLFNKSFTTFSGHTTARALLFQMEKVFESYVTQQLRKALSDVDWRITSQDKGFYLFDTPRRFALRPDIVIERGDGSKIILDAKWKNLVNKPKLNYGISQADMYQMYAYSKKYETPGSPRIPDVWLLYPINPDLRDHKDISFSSRDGVNVHLFFVDVANITKSMEILRDKLIYQL